MHMHANMLKTISFSINKHSMKKSITVPSVGRDFLSFMQSQIQEKKSCNKIKTSANYKSAFRAFTHFLHTKGYGNTLCFKAVTEELLQAYETYLQHERGISRNSSSFYIRPLHTVYKKGISLLNLKLHDPFSQVYTGVDKTRKRAVGIDVIVKLMQCNSINHNLELSRDAFVFCFFARGMSFIDLAKLKKENLLHGRLTYYRSKTGRLLSVKVDRIMQQIIHKYNDPASVYLFPILKTPEFQQTAYETALRAYNNHLKKLSKMVGHGVRLTSYVARHSWASEALRLHIPTHVISESMGHSNEKTTSIYLTSLDHRELDAANKKILDMVNKKTKQEKKDKITAPQKLTVFYSITFPYYFYSTSTQEVDNSVANVDKILKLTK